jgi:hypothetical protein
MVNTRISEAKRIILESPGKCWKILEKTGKLEKSHEKSLENTGKNWKTGKMTGKWCDFLS